MGVGLYSYSRKALSARYYTRQFETGTTFYINDSINSGSTVHKPKQCLHSTSN